MLLMFIGIGWWAFSPRNKARFEEAANSLFDDEPTDRSNGDKH